MGALERYMQLTGQGVNAQPHTEEQSVSKSLPKVDSSNAIGSLAALLGPTRAELEAQERHRQESKAKMSAWTGFFDGIRQLSNLYYTTRGATPQKYTDNPYQQVEQMVQADRQRADELANYERSYRQLLYNLQRQADQDQMRREAHEAQMDYYKNRDEQNAKKIELAEFKAKTDADYKKATLEQKNALNEVKLRLMEGQISKVEAERQYKLIMAGNAQKGTETTVTKSDGTVTTTVRKPAGSTGNRYSQYKKGSSGKGSSSGKYDQYKINK